MTKADKRDILRANGWVRYGTDQAWTHADYPHTHHSLAAAWRKHEQRTAA